MTEFGNSLHYTVAQAEKEMLLRKYLLDVLHISKSGLCKLKYQGKILCNGEPVTVRKVLTPGDQITLIYPKEKVSEHILPEPLPIQIVYEDEDLLLLNKQAGICVHPTTFHPRGTLANGVMYYLQSKGEQAGFHAVNRLDIDTSGFILLAKNSYSKQQLFLQQQKKQLIRSYQALVQGRIPWQRDTITDPIRKITGNTTRREVHPAGQLAITHVEVIKAGAHCTRIQIRLVTGRTHQIRIHLANRGFPLLGDELYGGLRSLITRQALHADFIEFAHPRTAKNMCFRIPLPSDMKTVIDMMDL